MKLPVEISFHGMQPSEALEARAREKAAKLEQFFGGIMSCRVSIDLLHKHRQQGRPFGVRIDLTIPGQELAVDRVENEDVLVALRDAFDAMRRQLEDVAERMRGEEKVHAPMLRGEVVRLGDDFGFIRTASGDEYWFGPANVHGAGFAALRIGSAVQFIADAGHEGPQAKRVTLHG